ncbi:MAG TPA: CheR family methyltransferase [Polyangiaceae bacterium]|nr:CheR family methyltransferase [Polyangiaceae bacterium]
MKRIETTLAREIGLSVQSIGANALSSAVAIRMSAVGIDDLEHYANRLTLDPAERRALVEEIVVSETWFFRDDEVFRALERYVTGRRRGATRPLRVLSIPCATGEEAYSVAMVLFEQGLDRTEFDIRAVDVSARALRAAKRASYGRNSFRGNSVGRFGHYFEAGAPGEQRPIESVREAVTWSEGNVLDGNPPWAGSAFDVILCRNLLIYLDRESRSQALQNLRRWLADDGILFAGHAETLDTMDPGLQRLDRTTHFAYSKRPRAPTATGLRRDVVTEPRPPRPGAAPRKPAATAANGIRRREPPSPSERVQVSVLSSGSAVQRPVESDLAAAVALADRGQLALASSICERHLATNGASAEAYCLLGIVKQAAADSLSAMECFDKALYLDPAHYEALVHLALLHEQRGDRARAEHLRRRAERALARRATQ